MSDELKRRDFIARGAALLCGTLVGLDVLKEFGATPKLRHDAFARIEFVERLLDERVMWSEGRWHVAEWSVLDVGQIHE